MAARFTLEVKPIKQGSGDSFINLQLFHKECNGYKVVQARINDETWALMCTRCKKKIILKRNTKGTMPILQTAIDGEEREYLHKDARDKVVTKK